MEKMLHVKDLVCGYERPLFETGDIAVVEGEMIALLGRNGCGKSSLLRTIAARIAPLSGRIELAGREVSHERLLKEDLLSFLSTARIRQSFVSVLDYLESSLYRRTDRWGRIDERDEALRKSTLKELGLEGFENEKLDRLSDGQIQLVRVAGVMMRKATLVLLDEPASHLDLVNRSLLFSMLKGLCEQGKSLVFSTHDIHLAQKFASRAWIIHEGKLIDVEMSSDSFSSLLREVFHPYFE